MLAMATALPAAALDIGAPIPLPSHAVHDTEGASRTVQGVAGERGTLVLFICVHCPWVKRWSQRIAELGAFAEASGVGVIALNANDPGRVTQDGVEGMREQAKTQGFEFPYAVDAGSVLARAYGAQRTPEAFLFDAAGKLAYHGTIDDNAADPGAVTEHFLRDAIAALTLGQKPKITEAKALGCSIKFYPES
jgi:hypothetical protein